MGYFNFSIRCIREWIPTGRSYMSLCVRVSSTKLANGFWLNLRLDSISCLKSEEFNADAWNCHGGTTNVSETYSQNKLITPHKILVSLTPFTFISFKKLVILWLFLRKQRRNKFLNLKQWWLMYCWRGFVEKWVSAPQTVMCDVLWEEICTSGNQSQ